MGGERKFKNEKGNAIAIRVSECKLDDVDGVAIDIVGPASKTEMKITWQEFAVLAELGNALFVRCRR